MLECKFVWEIGLLFSYSVLGHNSGICLSLIILLHLHSIPGIVIKTPRRHLLPPGYLTLMKMLTYSNCEKKMWVNVHISLIWFLLYQIWWIEFQLLKVYFEINSCDGWTLCECVCVYMHARVCVCVCFKRTHRENIIVQSIKALQWKVLTLWQPDVFLCLCKLKLL